MENKREYLIYSVYELFRFIPIVLKLQNNFRVITVKPLIKLVGCDEDELYKYYTTPYQQISS